MRRIIVASILVFCLGLGVFIYSLNLSQESFSITPEMRVTYIQKSFLSDGSLWGFYRKTIRIVRADGSWKEYCSTLNSQNQVVSSYTVFALNGKGILKVSEQKQTIFLEIPRPTQPPIFDTVKAKQGSGYIGDGKILGFTTIINKSGTQNLPLTTEVAPDLNGLLLKQTDVTPDHTTVIEAVDLQFEHPNPQEFILPNYPIVDRTSQNP